jgi:hypothetical protein
MLSSSGNVGIGTVNPSGRFEIAGGSGSSGVQTYVSSQAGFSAPSPGNATFSGGAKLVLWNDTTTPQKLSIGMDENADMWFNNSGNQANAGITFYTGTTGSETPEARLKILKSGNVGIGTTAPTHTLQVQKTSVASPALMIGGGYYGGPRLQTYGLDADSNAWMGLGTDMGGGPYEHSIYFSDYSGMGMLTFGTYNGSTYLEKMRLTRAGNVGIGTTNPTHKLAVNGTIKAKEVIVETTGWSDYVFAEDYALAPLAEVEAHIKEHKHLPGIPSAAEVADRGVSMGEMQAKMMAKIEELTLHQIAQEKRMQTLEGENENLRKRVRELESEK